VPRRDINDTGRKLCEPRSNTDRSKTSVSRKYQRHTANAASALKLMEAQYAKLYSKDYMVAWGIIGHSKSGTTAE
jgi:hypothetical protein